MFDKYYAKLSHTGFALSLGRDSLMIWKQNELLWDDDVIALGVGVRAKLGKSFELNGGYYSGGAYTSQVFDATNSVDWDIIHWAVPRGLSSGAYGLVDLWGLDSDAGSDLDLVDGTDSIDVSYDGFPKLGSQSAVFSGTNPLINFAIAADMQAMEFWLNDDLPIDGIMTVNYGGGKTFTLSITNRLLGG